MADPSAIIDGLRTMAERIENVHAIPQLPTLRELTAHYVRAVVALYRGNKSAAARALGVAPSTVDLWLKRKAV